MLKAKTKIQKHRESEQMLAKKRKWNKKLRWKGYSIKACITKCGGLHGVGSCRESTLKSVLLICELIVSSQAHLETDTTMSSMPDSPLSFNLHCCTCNCPTNFFHNLVFCSYLFSDILTNIGACTFPNELHVCLHFFDLQYLKCNPFKVFSLVVHILSSPVPSYLGISYHHVLSHILRKFISSLLLDFLSGCSTSLPCNSFHPWWGTFSICVMC